MIQKRPDDQAPKKMAHQRKIAMEPKWSSGGLCYQGLPRWCVLCMGGDQKKEGQAYRELLE